MDTMDSSGLYRDITEFAHDTPGWVQHLAEVWTELGLLLFGVLFLVAWWRTRSGDARAFAVAVLAPLGTALAYVISETVKSMIDEERPCRAVKGALTPLVECPPHGDWSFPSNHSTIAGAAAVGLALAWPRIAALTLPMAVLMAFSRVFVGVHYPHDVAVGLVLGALVAFLAVRLATRPVMRVTEAMRGSRTALVTWFAGPGPAAPAPRAPRQDHAPYAPQAPYAPAATSSYQGVAQAPYGSTAYGDEAYGHRTQEQGGCGYPHPSYSAATPAGQPPAGQPHTGQPYAGRAYGNRGHQPYQGAQENQAYQPNQGGQTYQGNQGHQGHQTHQQYSSHHGYQGDPGAQGDQGAQAQQGQSYGDPRAGHYAQPRRDEYGDHAQPPTHRP